MPAPLMRVQLPSNTSPKATATAAQPRRAKVFTGPQFSPGVEEPTTTSVVRTKVSSALSQCAGHVLCGAGFIQRYGGQTRFKVAGRRRSFLRRGRVVRIVAQIWRCLQAGGRIRLA